RLLSRCGATVRVEAAGAAWRYGALLGGRRRLHRGGTGALSGHAARGTRPRAARAVGRAHRSAGRRGRWAHPPPCRRASPDLARFAAVRRAYLGGGGERGGAGGAADRGAVGVQAPLPGRRCGRAGAAAGGGTAPDRARDRGRPRQTRLQRVQLAADRRGAAAGRRRQAARVRRARVARRRPAGRVIARKLDGFAAITSVVTLYDELPWIDIENRCTKTATLDKEALYVAFPFAFTKPTVDVEVPLGRMTVEQDQQPGSCRDWYCHTHWVWLHEGTDGGGGGGGGGGGVLWSGPDTPLFALNDIVRGQWRR